MQSYAQQAEHAARAAREVERGAKGMTVQTIEAQDHTRGLAEQWDNTSNSVHGAVDEMLKAIAFLILQARQQAEAAAKGGNIFEQLLSIPTQFANGLLQAQLREDLRKQIGLMKEVDGILNDLKIEFGLVAVSSKTTTTSVGETTEILVELSEAYRSAIRDTQKVRQEITTGEKEAAADLFGTITQGFKDGAAEITTSFNDEREKLQQQLDDAQKQLDDAIKDKKLATKTIKIDVDLDGDGISDAVLEGNAAVQALRDKLAEQEKAQNEKLAFEIANRERELSNQIFTERAAASQQAFLDELAVEKERQSFLAEFGDDTTELGLENILAARLEVMKIEEKEQLRAWANEDAEFKRREAAIAAALAERIVVIGEAVRAGTKTEAEAQAERDALFIAAAENTEAARQEIITDGLADTDSFASAIAKRSSKQQQQAIEDIGAKIRALKSDWDFVTDAVTGATDIMLDAFQKFYDELDAMREADAAKAAGTRDKDFADLKKDLLDMRITYEEFNKQVASLRAEGTDTAAETAEEEKSILQQLSAIYATASKEQTRSRADAIDTQKLLSTEYADEVTKEGKTITAKTKEQEAAWDVLAQATSVAVGGMVGALAGLAEGGEHQMERFAIAMIDTIASTLDSVIPALVALIFGKAFAANPLTGGIVSAVAISGLLALAAVAKSALSKGMGSKMTGGYAGDGSMTEEKGVYHAGEFIHTKRHTKKYRRLFEEIHADGDPMTWFLNEAGKMTRDARADMLAPLLFDGLDPVAWILKENGVRDRMEIAREIVATLPGYRITDDRTVPHLLTNADGSVRGTKEIVGAIDRQTTALDTRLSAVEGEMQKVQATFAHQSAVKITGESTISGGDIAIVYEKQQVANLSS